MVRTTTAVAMVLLQAGITTPTTRAVARASLVRNNNNNKGKGKGKGAGYVPNPASKGKSKRKGKGIAFLDHVAFEDAHIPMMQGFPDAKGKPATQIHTNSASMDMELNVYLGDAATTMERVMKSRTVDPSAAIVQGIMPAMIAHDTDGLLRARLRPKEIQLPISKDQKTQLRLDP